MTTMKVLGLFACCVFLSVALYAQDQKPEEKERKEKREKREVREQREKREKREVREKREGREKREVRVQREKREKKEARERREKRERKEKKEKEGGLSLLFCFRDVMALIEPTFNPSSDFIKQEPYTWVARGTTHHKKIFWLTTLKGVGVKV